MSEKEIFCSGCLAHRDSDQVKYCGSQRCPGLVEMTEAEHSAALAAREGHKQALQQALKTLDDRATKP